MPSSNLPSSFASAAAGQNPNRDARAGARGDGRGNGSGEWSRQGRSANGTLTLRRTSTTPSSQTFNQPNMTDTISSDDPAVLAAMPVGSTVVESAVSHKYSRDELLSIFDNMQQSAHPQPVDVSSLFVAGWNPGHANGLSSRGWGKPSDPHVVPQDPETCWDPQGSAKTMASQEMTAEERELFTTDVNSTMKPPAQNKEAAHPGGGLNGRKASLSHGTTNNYGLSSPSTASRPGTRRRETIETNPFSGGSGALVSPVSATRPRDASAFWLDRKTVDSKESMYEEPEEEEHDGRGMSARPPAAGPSRTNTATSTSGFPIPGQWNPSTPGSMSGLGSFGNFALPGSSIGEKRPGNARGESRLAHLLPQNNTDNTANRPGDGSSAIDPNSSWRSRPRTDTDPFGDDGGLSGSAVLGGAQDTSPPPMSHPPLHMQSYDTPVKGSAGDFGMAGLHLNDHDQDPLSPSDTNPFRSPPGDRGDHEEGSDKPQGFPSSGDANVNYGGGFHRAFPHAGFEGSDRSQTSSVGAKAYPNLGNLSGWPSSSTPDRERAPFAGFGGSLFGQVGDIQSPGLGNLGGVFGPASTAGLGGTGSISRGSKLGSLFPPAMQAQMQSHDNESLRDSIPDLRQSNPLGAIGRNPLSDPSREVESPMRTDRPGFTDIFAHMSEAGRTPSALEPGLHGGATGTPGQPYSGGGIAPSFPPPQSHEPASAQARTMVMPDRMRWTYLDPQGRQQGPFTGLEMNDWFKGNFFTNDLRVKKLEDSEFEPLGQLIRRIGNSREPFLVPQIGIPHGPPAQGAQFPPNASGVIQPPLVNAFPSFGRTLTAEEQNNLERRKQEEQYYMARHREFITNQQAMNRMPMQNIPGLNHHSSAHSLHSQPSFGSITSPITMPPQAPIGPIGTGGSFFDPLATRQPAAHGESRSSLDMFREEELTHLTGPERQVLASMHNTGVLGGGLSQQPIGSSSPESGLRGQLPGSNDLTEDDEGFKDRLQEFEKLQARYEAERGIPPTSRQQGHNDHVPTHQQLGAGGESRASALSVEPEPAKQSNKTGMASSQDIRDYQQAQAAAAAAKLSGLPMPFPPPPSGTPLPAPAPQRVRSRSGTPDVGSATSAQAPPPLAPWAKESGVEAHKGPSLKEIQQAEALKAARAEEAAALARRNLLEMDAAAERSRTVQAAPGLPTTSTWGTASPVSAGPSSSSPWAKPTAVKGATPSVPTPSASDKKKTLADIQREEEARKQKAKEISAQTGAPLSAGKRYADLVSKIGNAAGGPAAATSAATTPTGSGWATVGAGGKVKGPPVAPPTQTRSTSTANLKPAPTAAASSPRSTPKTATTAVGSGRTEAMADFKKWVHNELVREINADVNINDLTSTLLALPLQSDIVADVVYASSGTIDGQRFVQEFIRRKKLAEKGVVEKTTTDSSTASTQASSAGGWNEVAKKSAPKDAPAESNTAQGASFKLVPDSGANTSPRISYTPRNILSIEKQISETNLSEQTSSHACTQLLDSFVRDILTRSQGHESQTTAGISHAPTNEIGDEAIRLGYVSLAAFVQANVTGPVLENQESAEASFVKAYERIKSKISETFRALCQTSLDTDGVSPYPHIPHIELFCLARFIFVSGHVLPLISSLAWTRLRIDLWHYKLLTQPSLGPGSLFTKGGRWTDVVTLQESIEKSLVEAQDSLFAHKENDGDSKGLSWPLESQVLFKLEEANCHILLGNDTQARQALHEATKLNGFNYALSGALGKRTRFQKDDISQLVVLAKSSEQKPDSPEKQAVPSALPLNDDTLLENIEFSKDTTSDQTSAIPAELRDIPPDNQPKLHPIDQIILLAEATLKDTFSPSDSLTLEEILPFAVRVIEDKSVNWQIYTQALLVRSRIELHRSRTVERGVLQMQAVADQIIVDTQEPTHPAQTTEPNSTPDIPSIEISSDETKETPASSDQNKPRSFLPAPKPSESASAQERLLYVNALSFPPRWHLESELAFAWTSVGSLVSALEIFKRIRLWPEVALCLAAAAEDEQGRGAGGDEKARGIVRWRLFEPTTPSTEDLSEESVDIDSLRPRDFQGAERVPPPTNAPRLWCILGDLEDDAKHYRRAWEVSNKRFARAQRSLGELCLKKNEWAQARMAYRLAVGVNRLNPEVWSRLGDIELRLGNFPDAAEAFQRAVASANDRVGGDDARSWSNMGSALLSWYREVVAEAKTRKERGKRDGDGDEGVVRGDEMPSTARAAEMNKSASQLLKDALAAFKRGATLADSNWRIWDNVITLAASLTPSPAFDDVLLGVRNVLRIRKSEDALDLDVLTLLVREATKTPAPAPGTGEGGKGEKGENGEKGVVYVPRRGSFEYKIVRFFEDEIVPLITSNSACWALVSRLRAWTRDFAGALDAAEKGWRAAIGGVGSASSLSASSGSNEGNWLLDKREWDVVIQRTGELVAAYENYGKDVEGVGNRWKGKARSAVRSVMGKAKENWEGDANWNALVDMLEDLR
ncbi:hypothetical protein F5Y18DRAFT_416247 [Xylariaceae sp. FL1019]|nr:hypothetical protein F5Y18DRAFT_416247 [Xylariaceae sp. FL1019]